MKMELASMNGAPAVVLKYISRREAALTKEEILSMIEKATEAAESGSSSIMVRL